MTIAGVQRARTPKPVVPGAGAGAGAVAVAFGREPMALAAWADDYVEVLLAAMRSERTPVDSLEQAS